MIKLISQVIADFANGEISQIGSLFDTTLTLRQYSDKSFYKTATLIAASCKSAAVFSGVDKETKDAMFEYGRHLGLAFQVVDDILDFTQTAEQLGKPQVTSPNTSQMHSCMPNMLLDKQANKQACMSTMHSHWGARLAGNPTKAWQEAAPALQMHDKVTKCMMSLSQGQDLATGNLTAPAIFALQSSVGEELEALIDSEFEEAGSLQHAIHLVNSGGGIAAARKLARQEGDLVCTSFVAPHSAFWLFIKEKASARLSCAILCWCEELRQMI